MSHRGTLVSVSKEADRLNHVSATSARAPAYLFVFFQALYVLTASGNPFRVPDEFEMYFQTEHFVDAGDISVPQTLSIRQPVVVGGKVVGTTPIFFGKVGRDGKPYAPYGPLGALLSVPHHLVARGVAALVGVRREAMPAGVSWQLLVGGLTSLATTTAAALAVVGFYRGAAALGATQTLSLTLSLLLGGATVLWASATSFYSEAFVSAAFAWAAALLLEARADPASGRTRVSLAAFFLVVAILTKPTAIVFAPAFVVAATVHRRSSTETTMRVPLVLACGIAIAAGFHLAWNVQRFGHAMDFGYDYAETVPTQPVRQFALEELPRGLAVLLVSPGKSLFLWAPPLVLALVSSRRLWSSDRSLAAGLIVAAASGLVFFGSYVFPEGGYSHGPRHLVPLVPLLMLAAAHPSAPTPSRRSLLACGAVGGTVALLAVSVSFLEDQGATQDRGQGRDNYYERVEPAPGRPVLHYSLAYVPFVRALTSEAWLAGTEVGRGPDFLPYHLWRARSAMRAGKTIPSWLPWALPVAPLLLLLWSGVHLHHLIAKRCS